MSYTYLAVWHADSALSDNDAAEHYASLSAGRMPKGFNAAVYGFCHDLTRRYPDLDMVGEDEMDACPWACALEISEGHLIMALQPDRYSEVLRFVLELTDKHRLVCFDPQNKTVHLPSSLSQV